MSGKWCFVLVNLFIVSLLWSTANISGDSAFLPGIKSENHAPVVEIISPKSNAACLWNTPVNYTVSVSDAEDGESKFQEIESNEVLLRVQYLSDSSEIAKASVDEAKNSGGLDEIRKSNCLNCHAFAGALIGPSFFEINRRYPDTEVNRKRLEANILNGLSGVWGSAVMPTHPELSQEKAGQMVRWILTSAADSSVSYFRGTEGTFRIKQPATFSKNVILVVTASYIDHGIKDAPDKNLKGENAVTVRIK